MFLGTPRKWWIAAAVPLVAGVGLLATGSGGTLGAVGGILLMVVAMVLFGAAPMRGGRVAQEPAADSAPAVVEAPDVSADPLKPRPVIEAGDASEV